MKKIVHVISHTHWDREWYLPLENHIMRLVDLIDGVIRASKDERFKSFQMDGHYLPIEDYLKVKPENEKILKDLIERRKLIIGPWYILQDAFLSSGESNIRNLELGLRLSKKLGKPANVGYFPDTFGNIGQASQILNKAGIDVTYFGRGVKATGFDNQVFEDYTSKNSELIWESPDGSKTLGILFANWYCNGLAMPSNREDLKKYLDKRLKDCEKYASTNQLLLMNGCDHTPVQENIGEVLEIANSLYDDYEFIHSDLDSYSRAVKENLKKGELKIIKGELRSQETDGWSTLTSTSSTRYDLKKLSNMVEMRIENISQVLYSLFLDKKAYPFEKFDYLYKKLLSNLTHDAICASSIDSVLEGNFKRFKDCLDILDYLDEKFVKKVKNKLELDTKYHFFLINTLPYKVKKRASVVIDYEKEYINEKNIETLALDLEKINLPHLLVFDKKGSYESEITDMGVIFDFDLPDDGFRKACFSRKIKIDFDVALDPFEKREFGLRELEKVHEKIFEGEKELENEYFTIRINEDASLNIRDKRNKKEYKNVLKIEDQSDIGNEYIFKEDRKKQRVYQSKLVDKKIEYFKDKVRLILKEEMEIPESADESLLKEQEHLVYVVNRKALRSKDKVKFTIVKEIEFYRDSPDLDIRVKLLNKAKDHRMRILFGHDNLSKKIACESIFENVERRAYPPKTWKNPDYSQNFNNYVGVHDREGGFIISSIGLHEYENIRDEGLFITLFRSVGEMGDWGYFKTEDSQMLKEMDFTFHLSYFTDERYRARQKVLAKRVPYFSYQAERNDGKQLEKFDLDIGDNLFSTIYINSSNKKILRVFNPDGDYKKIGKTKSYIADIFGEDKLSGFSKDTLNPYEIRTMILEEK